MNGYMGGCRASQARNIAWMDAAFSVCASLAGWSVCARHVCVYVDLLSDTSGWDEVTTTPIDCLPGWLTAASFLPECQCVPPIFLPPSHHYHRYTLDMRVCVRVRAHSECLLPVLVWLAVWSWLCMSSLSLCTTLHFTSLHGLYACPPVGLCDRSMSAP